MFFYLEKNEKLMRMFHKYLKGGQKDYKILLTATLFYNEMTQGFAFPPELFS